MYATAMSLALVKQLREETGVGMMDCKKALSETKGDIVKVQEYLRKRGLASADRKSTNPVGSQLKEELVLTYMLAASRIGTLIEVNRETDFVARGDIFKELVEDLTMQVATCPQVQYLSTEDVPKDIVDKEMEIEMQKEDLLSKPKQIRSKIAARQGGFLWPHLGQGVFFLPSLSLVALVRVSDYECIDKFL
ncbi:uncharacterized protein LOC111394257 [Olea europaea var. sylvestris]|uniref:uncharacterized protein LOC111394257 n=1 Tax=Olea europaea var. sylvestris TaxID=158386 RepID=UPI000C1D509B|nr:uncharacterized protein LOC111394257 [Olea europaea var. sylvestris]